MFREGIRNYEGNESIINPGFSFFFGIDEKVSKLFIIKKERNFERIKFIHVLIYSFNYLNNSLQRRFGWFTSKDYIELIMILFNEFHP